MQKGVSSLSGEKLIKKRSPFGLLSDHEKKIFSTHWRDEMKAKRRNLSLLSSLLQNIIIITMAASSLTAAALGSKVALHKVRHSDSPCSLVRVLSFLILSCVRARRTERDGER